MNLEPLRELERVARRVNHGKSVSPTLIAWADRITAIIAALGEGQEVAPVAWEYRERGSDAPWVRGEGSINAQYNAEYWEVRRLYDHPPVSTGHTSDARDAARLDWLDAKCTNVADEYGIASQLYFGTYATGKLRESIDAAMRQEAGDV